MSYMSHSPFFTLHQGGLSPRSPRSASDSVPQWEHSSPAFTLHQTLFQLQHPPSNPQGLPQWALRPRPLDLDVLTHFSTNVENNWQSITSDMIARATARQFVYPSLLDQQSPQTLSHAAQQKTSTGRHFTDRSGDKRQDSFDESKIGDRDEIDENGDSAANKQPSRHSFAARNKYGGGEDFNELEDEGQEPKEDGQFDASDNDYVYARDDSDEDEPSGTSKRKRNGIPTNLISSKAQLRGDATLLDLKRTQLFVTPTDISPTPPPQAIPLVGGKAGKESILSENQELDQLLSTIADEGRMRPRPKTGNGESRFLKMQERLLAQFQARNLKRRMATLDDYSSNSEGSGSESKSVGRAVKRLKTPEDMDIANVIHYLDSGESSSKSEQAEPGIYPVRFSSTERFCEGSKPRVQLPSSRPNDATLTPTQVPTISRGSSKKDKWSDVEDRALIDLMVAQREWETDNDVPSNKWLKDVRLYTKISSQLAERGIFRSGNACKNQWNRAARHKSGFEERPDNGTTRAKICSEQKTRKEKEKKKVGSRLKRYR